MGTYGVKAALQDLQTAAQNMTVAARNYLRKAVNALLSPAAVR